MKRLKRSGIGSGKRREAKKMKAAPARSLQAPLFSLRHQRSTSTFPPSQNLQETDSAVPEPHRLAMSAHDPGAPDTNYDFILSQDFFCTPDYITPDNQNILKSVDCNKENSPCPKSPEKVKTVTSKRIQQGLESLSINLLSPSLSGNQQMEEPEKDAHENVAKTEKTAVNYGKKVHSYVPQSAVALRCRVTSPPCIKNPYVHDASETDVDPFGNQRSKCAGFFPAIIGGDGLSRYHSDFHDIEQIGTGNFSCVFKVLKRIDGCLYAVKRSTRQLHQDSERLSVRRSSQSFTENEALKALYQIAKALQFIHSRGIAHLDVKPDNIYIKNGVYKLGDFGCATLLNRSLPIEEGDTCYMPQEILNDDYAHLDKVDIFSLGVTIYELARGSPLPSSGPKFLSLREGKLPLLPSQSLQFQNLLKLMVDPDPVKRPSAKDLMQSPIFDKVRRNEKTQPNRT